MRRLIGILTALALLALTAGCSSDDAPASGDATTADTTLTVYAAASLKAAFEQIGADFEAEHDGVTVQFNFAGSSDLVSQIQSGAPADVFASADEANMAKLTADDLTSGEPQLFATNTLTIAVPPGNPGDVHSLADLTRSGLNVVVCAPQVPCGAATAKVTEAAGITLTPVSEEQSVTDVLAKVRSGEADAGLVYVTDVASADGAVEAIDFPESDGAVNRYPIAALVESQNADVAGQFVDYVLSDAGRQILSDAGFGSP